MCACNLYLKRFLFLCVCWEGTWLCTGGPCCRRSLGARRAVQRKMWRRKTKENTEKMKWIESTRRLKTMRTQGDNREQLKDKREKERRTIRVICSVIFSLFFISYSSFSYSLSGQKPLKLQENVLLGVIQRPKIQKGRVRWCGAVDFVFPSVSLCFFFSPPQLCLIYPSSSSTCVSGFSCSLFYFVFFFFSFPFSLCLFPLFSLFWSVSSSSPSTSSPLCSCPSSSMMLCYIVVQRLDREKKETKQEDD